MGWLNGLLFALISVSLHGAGMDLRTTAEKSEWKKTGRYDEVIRLCKAYEKSYSKKVRCLKFGTTPEGRPMMGLVVGAPGFLNAEKVKKAERPVVFFQGCIHAGESDGKDAGFLVLEKLLTDSTKGNLVDRLTVVFVPAFNIDGHERFGPHNRPNQCGPEEMGWRTTSQNLNLNRDYVKADSPEMVAVLKLMREWDPIVFADLHVTDGADFQHDIAVMVEPSLEGFAPLASIGSALAERVMKDLKTAGHLPLPFYPSFVTEDDPTSGVEVGEALPRFSHGYWRVRNRLGVLVETHSWKEYAQRVRATENTLWSLLAATAEDGARWVKAARKVDETARKAGGKELILSIKPTKQAKTIDFLGYEYKRVQSDVSGQLQTIYDPNKKAVWKIPLFDKPEADVVVRLPKAGYLVPASVAALVSEKLRVHGITFEQITVSGDPIEAEVFRATKAELSKKSFEGHTSLSLKGTWKTEKVVLPKGTLFVPVDQTASWLIGHLLEPTGPDSLAAWGFFNAHFEQKEYMEPYVAEQVAQELVKRDIASRDEFQKKLSADPEFAKSAEERLNFFYRKHPSWDDHFNRYPIFRVDKKL